MTRREDKRISPLLWDVDDDRCEELRFDYETASEYFRYIENQDTPIVIPYGDEGKAIIKKLQSNLPLTRQEYRQMNRANSYFEVLGEKATRKKLTEVNGNTVEEEDVYKRQTKHNAYRRPP